MNEADYAHRLQFVRIPQPKVGAVRSGQNRFSIQSITGMRGALMHNEFTALIEKHGEWYVGFCPEIPEANGQGRTVEDCRQNLSEAISLVLLDRREEALRDASESVHRETVTIAA